jgi:hypothetical protein
MPGLEVNHLTASNFDVNTVIHLRNITTLKDDIRMSGYVASISE